jgi:hypothetical protein
MLVTTYFNLADTGGAGPSGDQRRPPTGGACPSGSTHNERRRPADARAPAASIGAQSRKRGKEPGQTPASPSCARAEATPEPADFEAAAAAFQAAVAAAAAALVVLFGAMRTSVHASIAAPETVQLHDDDAHGEEPGDEWKNVFDAGGDSDADSEAEEDLHKQPQATRSPEPPPSTPCQAATAVQTPSAAAGRARCAAAGADRCAVDPRRA